MNYQDILNEINEEIQPYLKLGRVASYIPELAKIPYEKFGISLHTLDGKT